MNDNRQDKKQNETVTRRTVVIFAVCIAAILFITQIEAVTNLAGWLASILSPVIMGVIFAYIINPICGIFERLFLRMFGKCKKMRNSSKKRIARGLGVILSIVFLIAVIALLLFLIIPEFLESVQKFVAIAPSLIEKGGDWLVRNVDTGGSFGEHFGESIDTLVSNLVSWFGGEFASLIGGIVEGAVSIVSFLVNFLISLVICVYALLEKQKFLAQFKKLIFALFRPERANDILDVARYGNSTFGKFISGKLITSTIVGIVTFVFMTVMGMQYALLSACIIALTNVIPFFGPFIGGIPTAFFVLLTDVRHGVIYIVFLVVLQQLEGNVIEPMIMEDKTGVSKFWVTVALLFFGGVFGLAGMIFSVPLVAVLFYVIKICVERSLKKKSLPIPSEEYLKVGSVDPETNEIKPIPEKLPRKKLRDTITEWRARIRRNDENEKD